MGLFDAVFGAVTGGAQQGSLLSAVGGLLANDGEHGGIQGLVEKFNQAGLGETIGSWVGKGENLPISADQITQVLGGGTVANVAEKLGLGHGEAAQQLADALPGLIDKLTPHGQVPAGGLGNAGELLGALAGLLKS